MRRGWHALVCGLAMAACPGPAHAATVEAGPLRAEAQEDPWRLAFHDRRGALLTEAGGSDAGPVGALGFRTPGGWRRATRVLAGAQEGAAWTGELATTDPAGRRLRVRLSPDGEGAVRLEAEVAGGSGDVTHTGIAFESPVGERHLGFGERSNAVDQRGNEVDHYVAEGPYQPEEEPFLAGFVPPWGHNPRPDATYFPMPWLLSTRGYGVLVDNVERSSHRLGVDDPGAWSVEVESPRLALRVFAGPRPADVLRRLTERVGRQPAPAAPWVLGPWVHTGQENQPPAERERDAIARLRDGDAPVSAVEGHMRYLPCGAALGRRERERERTRFFHERGLASITYFNSEICQAYEPVWSEAARRGVLQRTASGEPYVFLAYVGDRTPPQTPISQIDFSHPGAQAFYDGLLGEAVADGHDGWMEDFGEYTPLDSHSANGMDGTRMHNLYPVLYHRAGYDFAARQERPIVRHVRSGWTGVHPYAQIVWGGDPTTDWGFDGLQSAVKNGLSMGLSGISTWGSDIGGFFSLGTRALSPELLTRWVQFGAVSGVMRTKHGGVAIPPKPPRPQPWEPGQLPNWRRYAKLRTQLYPYLVAADEEYRRTGLPLMRHLALEDPADPGSLAREDEFLFGPDLLAAPVLSPGQRRRSLRLPQGRWVDLWRSLDYVEREGSLRLRGAEVERGRRDVTVPAPLDELPLFARAGAVLPLLPPDVDTLADYGSGEGLVKLEERRDQLRLLAFPRGRSRAAAYDDTRLLSDERGGRWRLDVYGRREREYRLQASLATMRKPFRPCRVVVRRPGRRARRLPSRLWTVDADRRAFEATFAARTARLEVSGCERRRKARRRRPSRGG